jgi:TonB family protein
MMKRWWKATFLLAGLLSLCTLARSQDRKVKTRVAPVYPQMMKKMNIGGIVKLNVVVASDGRVVETTPIGGHPMLVEPAMEAVKRWKFEPAASQTIVVVEVKFDPQS